MFFVFWRFAKIWQAESLESSLLCLPAQEVSMRLADSMAGTFTGFRYRILLTDLVHHV